MRSKRHVVGMFVAAILLSAIGLLSTASAAEPQNRLDAILARKVLRIGTTGDYRPFSYLNPDTKAFEGIDIDMAKSLAKALEVEAQFVQTTWSNLMPDLLADKYDIAMGGVSISLERQKQALFTIPYLIDGKTAVTRCGNEKKYQTLAQIDRKGVRVVTNPGGTNERFDRANLTKAAIEVYPDNKTIWQQILEGKADLMITDASETRFWQKIHPGLCAVHPDKPFNFSEKAYLLPRDFVWKAFVDQWLHQAIETKEYRAIAAHWVK
ncbi:MAG TPA: transporter substrate-binding domain-containing protein [Alphaproteobacteria bacterium]|nr:transporter substrate-binding domain-containing protein [Alphaproteobacteria bacterium]